LADRFGPRIMIVLAVSGVAVGGLLIGLSNSYAALVVLLVLTAIMTGGYHPAAATALSALVPAERRGRAMGLHLIGGSSSFWVVPFLAVPIAVAAGWHRAFLFLSIPIVFLGIVLYFIMSRQPQLAHPKAVAASVSGTTTAHAGIRWRAVAPLAALAVGTAMITQSVSAYYSLYAVDHIGTSKAAAGLLMAIIPAVGALVAPFGGYLSDRFGAAPVVIISSLLAAPLLFAMSLVAHVAAFAAVLFFIGIVQMAQAPSTESYLVTNVPAERRGMLMGFYFFANMEFAGAITPVVGKFIDSFGFGPVLTGAAIAEIVLAIACSLLLRRSSRSAGTPQPA